jgi:hypothetical protein
MARIDMPGSPHICEEVGPAEAVDGLLGIADEKERRLFTSEDVLKNGVLDGVRSLEFIDEGGPITVFHVMDKVFTAISLQCITEINKEIVKGLDVSRVFSLPEFIPQIAEYIPFEKKELPFDLGLKLTGSRQEFLAVIKERVLGGCFSFIRSLFQSGRCKFLETFKERKGFF